MRRQYVKDPILIRAWDAFCVGFAFTGGMAAACLVALIAFNLAVRWGVIV